MMSDGSLSQDEIDALLMGDEPPEVPGGSSLPGRRDLSEAGKNAIFNLFTQITGTQGATLSGTMMMGVVISVKQVDVVDREQFLSKLPDEIVEIRLDLKSGLKGTHLFVLDGEDALKLASPMIGQDNLELGGTTIGAVSEAMGQLTSISAGEIGDRINDTVLMNTPEGQNIPKAMLTLPGDSFVAISYNVEIADQGSFTLNEIFDISTIQELTEKLGASSNGAVESSDMDSLLGTKAPRNDDQSASAGFQQTSLNMDPSILGANAGQLAPNVQGVQFPELSPTASTGEQRNIGLLMDVSMELTVELGRTKWRIKEILGMGEGTIIELDKLAGEPVDILVNNNLIARGEVVVIDENFGVRVTEIVSTLDRPTDR
ncbi:Flagellar motor switch protein FliN [Olavius algarvensis spirochete endosymbiont]|nr:MAG: Flagellar motor switch protein FliN [Olavius algarvensis spirochete endosymbiont]VDA99352.1 Flagellar motor switch protein FliN [Olavius algarvensis spirochete endosymbiont]